MSEDAGLSFSDVDAATKFRDYLGRQIEKWVNIFRPLPRYGRVMSFNRFTGKALVLFTGDIEATPCAMSKQCQPIYSSEDNPTVDPTLGDLVRVEGRTGSYYITAIVSNSPMIVNPVIYNPQFYSGGFLNIPSMKWDDYSAGLPALGNTWHCGRWDNSGSFGSDGTGLLEIQIQWTFFTNQVRKYVIPILTNMTAGGWAKVAPLVDSGPQVGNEYGLEIMVDSTGFELRIRRIRQGAGFSPGGWDLRLQMSFDNITRVYGSDIGEETTTEPTRYLGTQNAEEMKGPFLGPLMEAPRIMQASMTGGGQITWDGSTLGWTQSFRIGGLGQNTAARWGYFEATQPPNGTSIPVYGSTSATSVTATATGIPLSGTRTLYYEPPLGDTFSSVATQYRIVDSAGTPNYNEFNTPSHWILIAQRSEQSGTPSLKLGTGEQLDHWRAPSLTSPWVNWGVSHTVAGYKMLDGRVLALKGLVSYNGTFSGSPSIFTLPADYRPEVIHLNICKTAGIGTAARVDVNPDGTVTVVAGHSNGTIQGAAGGTGWVSLNGLTVPLSTQ